jgi:hypothetical protein
MLKKPVTPLKQLRNLCDALCEDALVDNKPLTKREREEAERLRTKLVKFVEEYEARVDREAVEPGWAKRAARKKGPPAPGHVM